MNRIYLLKRKGYVGYDEFRSHVIIARTEAKARSLAAEAGEDVGESASEWTDQENSMALVVGYAKAGQSERIVHSDYKAA